MKKAKYALLNVYSESILRTMLAAEIKPSAKGAITYILNRRAGKHSNLPTPAQRRAMLLGQMNFFVSSALSQLAAAKRAFKQAAYSDLSKVWQFALDTELLAASLEVSFLHDSIVQAILESTTKKAPNGTH